MKKPRVSHPRDNKPGDVVATIVFLVLLAANFGVLIAIILEVNT